MKVGVCKFFSHTRICKLFFANFFLQTFFCNPLPKKMADSHIIPSPRAKSGYKYVIYDGRARTKKPWSVSYRGYRSAGFATPREAALHLAKRIQDLQKPNAWMSKPNVHFDKPSCDLFGARITIKNRRAVIKSWTPCAAAAFGIVFDDQPDKVYMEDLFRKGRKDWHIIKWEDDDIWETQHLRPMCPQCGHPMGTGSAAWTKCEPCGHMEPGAASTEVLVRVRSGDPFRGP